MGGLCGALPLAAELLGTLECGCAVFAATLVGHVAGACPWLLQVEQLAGTRVAMLGWAGPTGICPSGKYTESSLEIETTSGGGGGLRVALALLNCAFARCSSSNRRRKVTTCCTSRSSAARLVDCCRGRVAGITGGVTTLEPCVAAIAGCVADMVTRTLRVAGCVAFCVAAALLSA